MDEKRWESRPVDMEDVFFLANGLKHAIKNPQFPLVPVSKLLVSNGIKNPHDAYQFLKPTPLHLHNPYALLDMKKAVDRILEAVKKEERILFHGDYDADGVTTIALAVSVLRKHFGANVDYYVPHRHRDGYGLNIENLEPFAHEYDLIISGDTGIKEFDTASRLKEIGKAELIITDHHEPLILPIEEKEKLPANAVIETHGHEVIAIPDAYAVVNPHRLGDPYPNKALSGVAVIFKLCQALFVATGKEVHPLYHYLDYVATGLVADLVPQIDVHKTSQGTLLDMEVRSMTALGLKIMNEHPKPWVLALKEAAGVDAEITASDLGFTIGPRLNAPGRLDDPSPAVELLLENDFNKAVEKAKSLNAINDLRKKLQEEATTAVLDDFKNKPEDWYDYSCVARTQSRDHHSGIAGLIASDLLKNYYRTSIVLCEKELKDGTVVLTGSARSIEGVSVIHCLKKTQDKIGAFKHGGHPQAAGLTLEAVDGGTLEDRFEEFRLAFREAVMEYEDEVFKELIVYNAEIELSDVTLDFIKTLEYFEPYGTGNKEAIFFSKRVELACPPDSLSGGKHAKLTLHQNGSTPIEALLWGRGKEVMDLYEDVLLRGDDFVLDILYKVSINQYGNKPPKAQLVIKDYKLVKA